MEAPVITKTVKDGTNGNRIYFRVRTMDGDYMYRAVVEMKVHLNIYGIGLQKMVTVKEWNTTSFLPSERDFCLREALELFRNITNPYSCA